MPAEFLPRAKCWLAIKRFVFSYSFQIGFGIAVEYQLGIRYRVIVDQIIQLRPLIHIVGYFVLYGDCVNRYDCMKHGIHCDVITIATGMAASMGAFLLAAGTKGKRYATNNAEIMIHQPLGGVQGQATDISLVADHIQYIKKKLASILAEECGKTQKKLMHDTERDNWMSSAAAREYGLIDHVGYPNENMEVRYDY